MADCFVISLNCAKRLQTTDDVSDLILQPLSTFTQTPDFIVLSLQEVAPIYSASVGYISPYISRFVQGIPTEYRLLAQNSVGAVALLVFAKTASAHLKTSRNAVAFGRGWSSLKGACSLTLELDESRFVTFVAAHLAAGEGAENRIKRNADFRYLFERLSLASTPGPIILAGDLNYRTSNGQFDTNELTQELPTLGRNEVFWEPPVSFAATYKYYVHTNTLCLTRQPSWCDRILLSNRSSMSYEVEKYDSVASFSNSDHRPVFMHVNVRANDEKLELTADQDALDSMRGAYASPSPPLTLASDAAIGAGSFLAFTWPGRALICVALLYLVYALVW